MLSGCYNRNEYSNFGQTWPLVGMCSTMVALERVFPRCISTSLTEVNSSNQYHQPMSEASFVLYCSFYDDIYLLDHHLHFIDLPWSHSRSFYGHYRHPQQGVVAYDNVKVRCHYCAAEEAVHPRFYRRSSAT